MPFRRPVLVVAIVALAVTAACSGDRTADEATGTSVPSPSSSSAGNVTTTAAASTSTTAPATTTTTTGDPPTAAAGRDTVVSLISGGVERMYRLHVPPETQVEGPLPLVLDLHGLTSDGEEQDLLSGMTARADLDGFVVAQPQGRGGPTAFWDATPTSPGYDADLAFLRDVVIDVAARVSVDPGAVYATGMSNGAGMANRLACDASDVFAAVGLVAGAYPLSGLCEPDRPMPVIAFHGTRDRIVPYDGVGALLPPLTAFAAGWAARDGCTGTGTVTAVARDVELRSWDACEGGAEVAFYTIEGGGHGWPGTTYREKLLDSTDSIDATGLIWEFFTRHRR